MHGRCAGALPATHRAIIDNFKPKQQFVMVPVSVPIQRHTYALRVHGDSMVSETGDSSPPVPFWSSRRR